jgi:hypothetical protein
MINQASSSFITTTTNDTSCRRNVPMPFPNISFLHDLPIELLRDHILDPFCDGKTLSTLASTLVLSLSLSSMTKNYDDDDDAEVIMDGRHEEHDQHKNMNDDEEEEDRRRRKRNHMLTWNIIPNIFIRRLNRIAMTIKGNHPKSSEVIAWIRMEIFYHEETMMELKDFLELYASLEDSDEFFSKRERRKWIFYDCCIPLMFPKQNHDMMIL